MPLNKLKTTSIEIDAITADLLATGSITLADINDGEITAAKLHQSGATDGQTLIWVNANGQWEPGAGGGGGSMSDLVDDTTPQLGGNLDLNSKTITGTLSVDADTDVMGTIGRAGIGYGGYNDTAIFGHLDNMNVNTFQLWCSSGSTILSSPGTLSFMANATTYAGGGGVATLHTDYGVRVLEANNGKGVDFRSTTNNSVRLTLDGAPSADRTIYLPDVSGTVVTTGNADVGVTSTSSSDADHILINDGGVLKKITPADLGIGGPTSAYAKFIYEISSTVTSVSGADVNGNTLSYTSGNNVVEVFVNGVKQQEGTGKDYQATTGNSVVFASDLYSGDLVDVIAYNMFDANVLDINTVLVNQNLGGDPANDDGNLIISHGATGQPMASIEAGAVRNIAIGNQNLTSLTTGDNNVALGKTCLTGINTGSNNLAIGLGTLQYGNHSDNVCVGNLSNSNSSSASAHYRNTSIGQGANQYCTTGDYDTCLGAYARPYYQNTSYTTAIGYGSRSGYFHCTSVGAYAGASMYNQSDYTTLIGNYAGYDLDAGDRATFIGYRAGYSGGSGSYNTAVGVNSMYDITSGERNTAIGDSAGYNIESGDHNTLLGQAVGYDLTTGDQNTLLGHNAGNGGTNDLVSGSNNTIIGYLAGSTSSSMSNTVVLGNASITSLQCNVQSISALSDERDKTDIQDLTLGLDFIKAMRPVQFTWNRRDGTLGTRKEVGFVAQELQEVEMDFNTKNRTHMVDDENPNKLLAAPMQSYPILIKAIQELSAKVDSLQAEVNTLKNGG